MSTTLANIRGGAILSRPESEGARRRGPRVVLAAVAAPVAEQFRRRGWDVHLADSAEDAATLALRKHAAAVVIPAESDDGESGYLVCAKVRRSRPGLKVVLVGAEKSERAERLSRFVGGRFTPVFSLADDLTRLVG